LCAGGALDRLGVSFASGSGSGALSFVPVGVSNGSTRFYQGWYRDAASLCTSATFNLTSANAILWVP